MRQEIDKQKSGIVEKMEKIKLGKVSWRFYFYEIDRNLWTKGDVWRGGGLKDVNIEMFLIYDCVGFVD